MTPAELKDALRSHARTLGFAELGVADAGPADPDGHLERWLAAGLHGSMDFLARTLADRLDARALCGGRARSVMMLLTPYRHERPTPPPDDGVLRGKVSRYAWGRDYHRVIQKRLRKLRRWFNTAAPGAWLYTSVDTGPVMEKAWAQRAGLGWIGKHGNVLSRTRSSWFFLSTLATDLHLPADAPHDEHCGTCDLCIRACPTQAIVSPGVVDARRCIAYHTIEHQDVVPEPLRHGHGDWVFGCDDCQDVCPWNRFAQADGDATLVPRREHANPDLLALLRTPADALALQFEGTPLARAGREGLARSAAMALGNLGERAAVGPLREALLGDASAVVRAQAAWALGQLGGDEARQALRAAAATETHPGVLGELAGAQAALADATERGKPVE